VALVGEHSEGSAPFAERTQMLMRSPTDAVAFRSFPLAEASVEVVRLSRFRIRAGIAIAAAVLVLAAVGATVYLLQGGTDRLESDSGKGGLLADYGSINALPGQSADFSAVVINPGNAQAVFVSAAVIPLRGYPVPRLVHLGLVHATPVIGSTLVSDYGWPPNGIKVRPFIGAGLAHGEIAVAFGVSGDTLGRDYAVAGLRIRYRVQGHV
jgi:hypothetical protein